MARDRVANPRSGFGLRAFEPRTFRHRPEAKGSKMTCIVGIEHSAGVTIGVDSASSDGLTMNTSAVDKLFENNGLLFGFTTSWRMGQLLRYSLNLRDPDTWDLDRWMTTTFIDAVRQTLKDGGFASVEHATKEIGGTFLVAVQGRLYVVHSDYQVNRAAENYAAIGSGARIALGSLATSGRDEVTRRNGVDVLQESIDRCDVALQVAAKHTESVRGPFAIKYQRRVGDVGA